MSFIKSMMGYRRLSKMRDKKIVIFSEGRSYWINFLEVVRQLTEELGLAVVFVTASEDDPAFKIASANFTPIYIGSDYFQIRMFKNLEAAMLLSTLPDIGAFHLMRPPKVGQLAYINHNLCSLNIVFRSKAFACYDVILCSGLYQEPEALEMADFYGYKRPAAIRAGYPPLDDLIERLENTPMETGAKKNLLHGVS